MHLQASFAVASFVSDCANCSQRGAATGQHCAAHAAAGDGGRREHGQLLAGLPRSHHPAARELAQEQAAVAGSVRESDGTPRFRRVVCLGRERGGRESSPRIDGERFRSEARAPRDGRRNADEDPDYAIAFDPAGGSSDGLQTPAHDLGSAFTFKVRCPRLFASLRGVPEDQIEAEVQVLSIIALSVSEALLCSTS